MKLQITLKYDDGEACDLDFEWSGDNPPDDGPYDPHRAPDDEKLRSVYKVAADAAVQHRRMKNAKVAAKIRLGVEDPSAEEILVSAGVLRLFRGPRGGYVPADAPLLPCEMTAVPTAPVM